MKKFLIFILLLTIGVSACKDEAASSGEILDKHTYKAVLKEIILANSVAQQLKKNKDTLIEKKILGLVYKKYGIDSLTLKKTTDFYSKKPEILEEIYKEIKEELEQKKDSMQKLVAPVKLKNDSVKLPENLLKGH